MSIVLDEQSTVGWWIDGMKSDGWMDSFVSFVSHLNSDGALLGKMKVFASTP